MTNPTETTANVAVVDDKVISKLRKILALTESPEEGEAATAALMLQRFLTEYNLSISDLESKGAAKVVAVTESGIDLGKAAFRWKLDLAEEIAEHYFCVGIVSRYRKTVTFAGRPENVEALKMLYTWVVDQIKRLSSESRKAHQVEHSEHVDPLRWQVNFGVGAVERLMSRLNVAKAEADSSTTALAIHHAKEISDYTEKKYNRRYDGQESEYERISREKREKYYAEWEAKRKAEQEADEKLLATDPTAYYEKYPDRHPDVVLERERREARNAARRARYQPRGRYRYYDYDKEEQGDRARSAGRRAADNINLEPFLSGKTPAGNLDKKGGR